jgi:hypothetical protein
VATARPRNHWKISETARQAESTALGTSAGAIAGTARPGVAPAVQRPANARTTGALAAEISTRPNTIVGKSEAAATVTSAPTAATASDSRRPRASGTWQ